MDSQGNHTTVKTLSNQSITVNYRSSEGVKGEVVWNTRSRSMHLHGCIADVKISCVMCDYYENQNLFY